MQHCSDIQDLVVHLRNQIKEGLSVSCPFVNCTKEFDEKKSFSSHVSRYHRDFSVDSVMATLLVKDDRTEKVSPPFGTDEGSEDSDTGFNICDKYDDIGVN